MFSLKVYSTPIRDEEYNIGFHKILEYSNIKINTSSVFDIVVKDNQMYIISSDGNDKRMQKLEVYNLETKESSTICNFEDPLIENFCTTQLYGLDYFGGLELVGDTLYLYSQNGLYHINNENEIIELIPADIDSRFIPLLYLENDILIYENTSNVYEISGTKVTLIANKETIYSFDSYPYTKNLILVQNSDNPNYDIIINGVYYSGFNRDNLDIYTETIFTGYINDTSQNFILIDGRQINLDFKPKGVLVVEDTIFVVKNENTRYSLFNPINSKITSNIYDDLDIFQLVNHSKNKYFVTFNGVNTIIGFGQNTIVYIPSMNYNFGYFLILPLLYYFYYLMYYEIYGSENKQTK